MTITLSDSIESISIEMHTHNKEHNLPSNNIQKLYLKLIRIEK